MASPPDTLALEELGRQLTGLPAHVVAAKLSVFKQGVRRPLLQQMEAHGLHGSIRRTGRLEARALRRDGATAAATTPQLPGSGRRALRAAPGGVHARVRGLG